MTSELSIELRSLLIKCCEEWSNKNSLNVKIQALVGITILHKNNDENVFLISLNQNLNQKNFEASKSHLSSDSYESTTALNCVPENSISSQIDGTFINELSTNENSANNNSSDLLLDNHHNLFLLECHDQFFEPLLSHHNPSSPKQPHSKLNEFPLANQDTSKKISLESFQQKVFESQSENIDNTDKRNTCNQISQLEVSKQHSISSDMFTQTFIQLTSLQNDSTNKPSFLTHSSESSISNSQQLIISNPCMFESIHSFFQGTPTTLQDISGNEAEEETHVEEVLEDESNPFSDLCPLNLAVPQDLTTKEWICTSCGLIFNSHQNHQCSTNLKNQKTRSSEPLNLKSQPLDLTTPNLYLSLLQDNSHNQCCQGTHLASANDAIDFSDGSFNFNMIAISQESLKSQTSFGYENSLKENKKNKEKESTHDTSQNEDKTKSFPLFSKSCHICGKKLFSNSGFLKHMKVHKNKFRLHCSLCGKGFFDSCNLKSHVDSSHNKVKNFSCWCGKNFFRKHHLKRHASLSHSNSSSNLNSQANSPHPLTAQIFTSSPASLTISSKNNPYSPCTFSVTNQK